MPSSNSTPRVCKIPARIPERTVPRRTAYKRGHTLKKKSEIFDYFSRILPVKVEPQDQVKGIFFSFWYFIISTPRHNLGIVWHFFHATPNLCGLILLNTLLLFGIHTPIHFSLGDTTLTRHWAWAHIFSAPSAIHSRPSVWRREAERSTNPRGLLDSHSSTYRLRSASRQSA